jgi:CRISPR-associated endonuclease/helicase Cas3
MMPALGQHITETTDVLRKRLDKQISDYQRVLEKLTEAWARGTKVQVWYRPLNARKAFQHTFAPYFLEPSAIGYSTYAIGRAEPPGELRTRKLERIERIVSTDEPFDIPADFDPNALLAGAWGIWFDENDQPTTVKLRFTGSQALRRMSETIWHPSERKEQDSEGRLIWTAEIDEPHEMLPWIRGWGADCAVLEPEGLRRDVQQEVLRLARCYNLTFTPLPTEDDDDYDNVRLQSLRRRV